jgi:hypothetical protein
MNYADAQNAPGNAGDNKPGKAAGPPAGKTLGSLQDLADRKGDDETISGSKVQDYRG